MLAMNIARGLCLLFAPIVVEPCPGLAPELALRNQVVQHGRRLDELLALEPLALFVPAVNNKLERVQPNKLSTRAPAIC